MNRRHFLRQSGAAVAAAAVLGPGATRALAAARAADVPAELGIQLYTLRDLFPGDVNGVLEMLARYGYGEVETAGYAERTPAAFAAVLQTMNFQVFHVISVCGFCRARSRETFFFFYHGHEGIFSKYFAK